MILAIGVVILVWYHTLEIPEPDQGVMEEETEDPLEDLETEEGSQRDLPPINLVEQTVSFEDGSQETLRVAENFEVSVAAEGLGKARFMTESPDGRVFVPDMVDYNLSREGKIFILDDFDEDAGRFQSQEVYLSNLRGPNNVEFYTDQEGQSWIYITLTEHLIRYPFNAGDTSPSGEPEVIFEFPNEQHPESDSIVWHITRTILFDQDTLYVSIGSGCNVCEESFEEDGRPAILTMTPEGENVELYAEGIKNAVGMELVNGELFVTENGVDHISPNDLLIKVEKGEHYGWPFCYELDGEKYLDTAIDWQESFDCQSVPESFTSFVPHSAPLGLKYFQNTHPDLEETFLVAMQGSWEIEVGNGYEVIRVTKEGEQEVFMEGFLGEDEEGEPRRIGRPVGIMQKDENSFFVSDDWNGRIYYVYAE